MSVGITHIYYETNIGTLLYGIIIFGIPTAIIIYAHTQVQLRELKRRREDLKNGEKSTGFDSLQEILRNPSTPFIFLRD